MELHLSGKGALVTGGTAGIGLEIARRAPAAAIEAEFFAKGRPASLIQRMIEPDEVASLVAYVASPLSGAINGAALRVEGGLVNTVA